MATVPSVDGPDEHNHYRAAFDDGGQITFGQVKEQPVQSGTRYQTYHAKGYWWVRLNDKPQTLYIISTAFIVEGQISLKSVREGRSRDESIWAQAAVAVISLQDLVL